MKNKREIMIERIPAREIHAEEFKYGSYHLFPSFKRDRRDKYEARRDREAVEGGLVVLMPYTLAEVNCDPDYDW